MKLKIKMYCRETTSLYGNTYKQKVFEVKPYKIECVSVNHKKNSYKAYFVGTKDMLDSNKKSLTGVRTSTFVDLKLNPQFLSSAEKEA